MLLLAALLSCQSQYGYSSLTRIDVFEQVRRNTVDVLLVIDDSCSMGEEQDKLAANFDSFIEAFEGVDVDWQIGVTTTDLADLDRAGRLRGGDDEIVLSTADGLVLDRVAWDDSWEIPSGASLQLDPGRWDITANDAADSWCASTVPYGDGDLGTPGSTNASCDDGSIAKQEDGGWTAGYPVREPIAGDLVITELMVDPRAVPDAQGEWVEIANLSEALVELDGCTLTDDGGNRYVFPEDTMLGPSQGGIYPVIARETDDTLNGGVVGAWPVGDAMTLNDPVRILTPDLPDAAEIFSEMVAVGTGGAGFEMGLETARLALSEPLVSGDNAGFLRPDARLALIFLSDEDDFSPLTVSDYLLAYGDSKGDAAWRTDGMLTVSAVAGIDKPAYSGAWSCESDDGAAEYGARFVELAAATGGAVESICDDDFSSLAAELGLVASGLQLELGLSEPASPESLVVRIYQSHDDESLISEPQQDVDYHYIVERNSILFEPAAVPPSQSVIVVEYQVLAEGQQVAG